MDYMAYILNNCTDSRVPKLFGVTPEDDFFTYTGFCVSLATDIYQSYDNFSCNPWLCNYNGTCNYVVNADQVVNATCTCNSGFMGLGCQFQTKNYNYGQSWLSGMVQFINRKTAANNGNLFNGNVSEFLSYIDLASNLFYFTSSINPDTTTVNNVKALIAPIFNSNVTLDNATQDAISPLLDYIVNDPLLSTLIDPLVAVNLITTDKASAGFGQDSADVDPNNDASLSFNGRRRLFEFTRKFLQATKTNTATTGNRTSNATKTVNMENPRCTVPKDVTSKLPTGSKLSLSFVRDPKSYNNNATSLNGNLILSQVLSIGAKANGTATAFPTGVSAPYSCNVPFANVPLSCPSFQQNCQVVSLNNGVWRNETKCTLGSNTNGNTAVVNCNTFGTVAVACNRNCKVDTAALGSNTKRTNTTTSTNKTSGNFVVLSSMIISLLALLLI